MDVATIAVACFGVAIAAWLVPASVDIISWSKAGIDRVALYAPLYTLWVAFGAALALAGIVWFAGSRSREARAHRAHVLEPLAALWLWTIPFLPWIGERLPLLLILAGPIRWLIAAAAGACVCYRVASPTIGFQLPGRKTAFILSLAIYVFFGLRSLSIVGLGGDEPHYLIITQSLLVDHDLKIENQHTRGDYRAFYGGPLKPDYMERGINGEIYSIHAPGLPALLLPGYAVAGSRGAVVTICLFAALAALAMFDLASRIGGAGVAWITWLSVCLTVPFIPHAWAIYPEMPAAAIVAWTIVWATSSESVSPLIWMLRGFCLGLLPWLHTKFVVFLAALLVWLVIKLRGRVKETLALLAPPALSGAAWLGFFYVLYGKFDPQAPYGGYTAQFVRFENIPRSLLGILFDQKFGLFVYAPIYLLAALGAWLLWKERRWRALASGAICISVIYAIGSARLYMWWGGSSAPARFLVPLVPLAAPMIAMLLARLRGTVAPVLVWGFAALSLVIAATDVFQLNRLILFSDPHGSARIAQLIQGSAPLTGAFPTFTDENWTAPLVRLGPWILGALVAIGVGRLLSRRARVRGSIFWIATIEAAVFLVVVATFSSSLPAEARADSVMQGRLALLGEYDPVHLRAFNYPTMSKMPPAAWMAAGRITFDLNPSEPADEQGRVTGALTLPAGRYEVKVWFEGERTRDGDLLLAPGGGQILTRVQGPLPNPAVAILDMPVPAPQLWIQLTEVSSAQQVVHVELTPLAIVPVGDRPKVEVRRVESIPAISGAYVAYVDDFTFPEGGVFWTRGTDRGEVLVVPEGAGQADVTLHIGPGGGAVRLSVAGREQLVEMKANETRTVPVALPPGSLYFPISVQSPTAFEPSKVEPGSIDARSLGCQVRIEVR